MRTLFALVKFADHSLFPVLYPRLPQDVRFWVLFLSFLCSAGSGLVVINNIASLTESLGMASSDLLVRKTNPTLPCAGALNLGIAS